METTPATADRRARMQALANETRNMVQADRDARQAALDEATQADGDETVVGVADALREIREG